MTTVDSGEHTSTTVPPVAAPITTVAHVIHSLGAGGAEAVLVELARAAPFGLRLVVIGLSDAREGAGRDDRVVPQLRELGVTVHQLHSGRYDLLSVRRLVAILRTENVDVVHTHLKHADVVGGLAARFLGIPAVSTLHVIEGPTSRLGRWKVKCAMLMRRHLATSVIALSEAQRRWYTEQAGPEATVTLLPNGVGEHAISRAPGQIRLELDVPEDSVFALCVSIMRPEKGHLDLLEALRRLPADLRLVVGLAGDGPLLEFVRREVSGDDRLRDRVRILGFRRDIPDLLEACDFVIQPSREDALPTSLISALAAGKLIVATNVGGIPDIVGTDCGLLVESGRPDALAEAIVNAVALARSGSDDLAVVQRDCRRRYDERFSSEVWTSNLRALYERVRSRRRLVLVQFAPSGGLFQFSLQLGEALARAGDDVELLTGPAPELTSRERGCHVRTLLPTWHPTAGADAAAWWRRLRRAVRAGQHAAAWLILLLRLIATRPDVVIWSVWRFPVDGWGVHVARRLLPNAVLGLIAHEPRPLAEQAGERELYKRSGLTDRALALAYSDLDVVFVLGESTRAELIANWPVTAPVHVIPHGDERILSTTEVGRADTTGPVALLFGTITRYKGFDSLLAVWPTVRREIPDAELLVVGAVSSDVDALALRSAVAELPGVTLHSGYVPVPHVAQYFARARCVVLPYKRGSQSGVAHLAHTFCRPVVATRVGDIPSVVVDGVSGLLVDHDDPPALARAVIRLLTDPAMAADMGAAGAAALTDSASWDTVADQLRRRLPSTARTPSIRPVDKESR